MRFARLLAFALGAIACACTTNVYEVARATDAAAEKSPPALPADAASDAAAPTDAGIGGESGSDSDSGTPDVAAEADSTPDAGCVPNPNACAPPNPQIACGFADAGCGQLAPCGTHDGGCPGKYDGCGVDEAGTCDLCARATNLDQYCVAEYGWNYAGAYDCSGSPYTAPGCKSGSANGALFECCP